MPLAPSGGQLFKDSFAFEILLSGRGDSFALICLFLAKTIVVEFVESGNQRERDRGRGQLTMVCASNWD